MHRAGSMQFLFIFFLSLTIATCLFSLTSGAITGDQILCRCWGDIHCETWDGTFLDFQGVGEYVLANHSRFSVHATLEACSIGSCLRQTKILVRNPAQSNSENVIATGGTSKGSPLDDVRICNSIGCSTCTTETTASLAASAKVTPNGQYKVSYDSITPSVIVEPISCPNCPRFAIGSRFVNIYVPVSAGEYSQNVQGICGKLGNLLNQYTGRNNQVYISNAQAGQWYVSSAVNNFGQTFAVDGTNLARICPTDPVPSTSNSAINNTAMSFASASAAADAAAYCQQVAARAQNNQVMYQQCLFDLAATQDQSIAGSSAQAVEETERFESLRQPSADDSWWTNDRKAIVGLSIALGVTVIGATAYVVRTRYRIASINK